MQGNQNSKSVVVVVVFIIYNRWHIRWRKPCQLPGWIKNASYYSTTDGIRISDLPYSTTITMGKYPSSHNGGLRFLIFVTFNHNPPLVPIYHIQHRRIFSIWEDFYLICYTHSAYQREISAFVCFRNRKHHFNKSSRMRDSLWNAEHNKKN